jgi:low affinity Fe/Cu permease
MTLFIQRAEHRDTQAIHAKLDELSRVDAEANNELATLDQKEPEEIEKHQDNVLRPLQERPGLHSIAGKKAKAFDAFAALPAASPGHVGVRRSF